MLGASVGFAAALALKVWESYTGDCGRAHVPVAQRYEFTKPPDGIFGPRTWDQIQEARARESSE